MNHQPLATALRNVLRDDAAEDAECRQSMLQLLRWTVLGGHYNKSFPTSALIYVAAEVGNVRGTPSQQLTRFLSRAEYSDLANRSLPTDGFYRLLATNHYGIYRPLNKTYLGDLSAADIFVEKMLGIYIEMHRVSQEDVHTIFSLDHNRRKRWWYRKHILGRYRWQLAFIYSANKVTGGGFAPFDRKDGSRLTGKQLVQHLTEWLAPKRVRPFLACAKAVIDIIDHDLAVDLRSYRCWDALESARLEDLGIDPLSPDEALLLTRKARRPAEETKKTRRQTLAR